jgi:hypothetical protein
MTIDKSQEQEFENVCVMFDRYSEKFLTKNKLYIYIYNYKDCYVVFIGLYYGKINYI